MKVHFKVGNMTVEADAACQLDLFKARAKFAEVFSETTCGMCGTANIRYEERSVDGNDFYELQCDDPKCGAKLAFGQSKQHKGKMFPIRKLTKEGKPSRKEGVYDAKHRGWTKYRGKPVPQDSEE